MADPRHALGTAAEAAAAAWLTRRGWAVLATRCRPATGGELDLVAVDPAGVLVGVEVRARRTRRTGAAAVTVDGRRVARLRRALVAYAMGTDHPHQGLRVDLVTAEPEPQTEPRAPPRWRLTRLPGIG